VIGSFRVLNPKFPVYVDIVRRSLEESYEIAEENSNLGRLLVKDSLVCLDPGTPLEDPAGLSSSMTNSLDSESDPAYCPSLSPTPSSSPPGSNRSSCDLVDMAPKRTRQVCDDADQAGPSGVHFNLQEKRTEWADI
jgi:hypothetical protein